jgi:hypothetical protein
LTVLSGGGGAEAITKNYDGGLMIVGNYLSNNMLKQVAIALAPFKDIGYYKYTAPRSLFYANEENKCSVGFNEIPIRGGIKITKFERGEDIANNLKWLIISGTFEGVLAPNASCKDTTYITQGRFDVKFQ